MKTTKLLILTIFTSLNFAFAQGNVHNDPDSPLLEGSYLGQEPPGLTPEVFAPGIVSTDGWEVSGVFTPDLKEFYYIREGEGNNEQEIVVIKKENNRWQESEVFPRVGTPFIAPDGKTMHLSRRYKERTAAGWSATKSLETPFKDLPIMRLTASAKGTYFFDEFKSDFTGDIRYARLVDGKYEEPKLLGENINSGKSFHPFIAPDESYLIFDGKREGGYGDSDIYISFRKQDGTLGDPINLGDKINTPAWEAMASVTPDGKYLFFNRNIGSGDYENVDIFWVDTQVIETLRPKSASHTIAFGSNGICLTDADVSPKVRLTSGSHGYPAWSPDGKRIAFYGYYDGGKTWSIHTINSDGTNMKRLTHVKNKWDNMPTWSPDGTKIVFARDYRDSANVWHYELWMMNADGSEQTQIKSLSGGGPCFLPDGRLLFHSEHPDKESEISIANIDGSNIIHLTDNEAEEWDPKISPDGKQIAYSSKKDGKREIYVMNIDGSNKRQLTNNDVDDGGPSWSDDGSQLIFHSERDGETSLYIMNKDGSSMKKLVSDGWQPAVFSGSK